MQHFKTTLASVVSRKHTCRMVNILRSDDTKSSEVIDKTARKKEINKGGVMALVRKNMNARETNEYMEKAEYQEHVIHQRKIH